MGDVIGLFSVNSETSALLSQSIGPNAQLFECKVKRLYQNAVINCDAGITLDLVRFTTTEGKPGAFLVDKDVDSSLLNSSYKLCGRQIDSVSVALLINLIAFNELCWSQERFTLSMNYFYALREYAMCHPDWPLIKHILDEEINDSSALKSKREGP